MRESAPGQSVRPARGQVTAIADGSPATALSAAGRLVHRPARAPPLPHNSTVWAPRRARSSAAAPSCGASRRAAGHRSLATQPPSAQDPVGGVGSSGRAPPSCVERAIDRRRRQGRHRAADHRPQIRRQRRRGESLAAPGRPLGAAADEERHVGAELRRQPLELGHREPETIERVEPREYRGRVAGPATEAGLHRDALDDLDPRRQRAPAGVLEHVDGAPRQVRRAAGAPGTDQRPLVVGRDPDLVLKARKRDHQACQRVVAVGRPAPRPAAPD